MTVKYEQISILDYPDIYTAFHEPLNLEIEDINSNAKKLEGAAQLTDEQIDAAKRAPLNLEVQSLAISILYGIAILAAIAFVLITGYWIYSLPPVLNISTTGPSAEMVAHYRELVEIVSDQAQKMYEIVISRTLIATILTLFGHLLEQARKTK